VVDSPNRHEEAVSLIKQGLALSGSVINVHYKGESAGTSLRKVDSDAIKLFDKALSTDKSVKYEVCYFKGLLYKRNKIYDKAEDFFSECLKIHPEDSSIWNELGICNSFSGKTLEAYNCFDKFTNLNPNESMGWNNKGNALNELGRKEEALICYRKAVSLGGQGGELAKNSINITDTSIKHKIIQFLKKSEILKLLISFFE
jgi:tetratricopeptide (TPR) repeat protein